jgi:L-lactate permease
MIVKLSIGPTSNIQIWYSLSKCQWYSSQKQKKNNAEKGKQIWKHYPSWFKILTITILLVTIWNWHQNKHKPKEWNIRLRNASSHIWSTNFSRTAPRTYNEEWMMLEKLDFHMQKNEITPLYFIMCKNQMNV